METKTNPTDDTALLTKLNAAVAAANEAEKIAETAKAEFVSRSKAVGLLLLEAKKLHPRPEDFWLFVKKVQGLGQSRAYDFMRLAGGRVTDEELRRDATDRQRKSRANKKKLPKPAPALKKPEPEPEPKPDSVTVTESASAEISIGERKAQHADLDLSPEEKAAKASARYLAEFAVACRTYLPKITVEADRQKARLLVSELTSSKPKAEAA